MSNVDLFSKIEKKYKTLTTSEKKVADFVRIAAKDILYMSITDLAEACDVGDTTVFRFCKVLKLNGYQEFRMVLAQSLSNNENDSNLTLTGEIKPCDTTEEVCQKVLSSSISSLNETFGCLNFNDIKKAVDMISSARRINFFGSGSSGVTAMEARNKFLRIIPYVNCIQDSHMQSMSAVLMDENDLAIAFSYSGSTKDIIDVLKIAKSSGTKTICITRFAKSPIASYADLVLLSGYNEGPLQGGSLSVKISQLYIVDVLYSEFFKLHNENCQRNKHRTTEAISAKLL